MAYILIRFDSRGGGETRVCELGCGYGLRIVRAAVRINGANQIDQQLRLAEFTPYRRRRKLLPMSRLSDPQGKALRPVLGAAAGA